MHMEIEWNLGFLRSDKYCFFKIKLYSWICNLCRYLFHLVFQFINFWHWLALYICKSYFCRLVSVISNYFVNVTQIYNNNSPSPIPSTKKSFDYPCPITTHILLKQHYSHDALSRIRTRSEAVNLSIPLIHYSSFSIWQI